MYRMATAEGQTLRVNDSVMLDNGTVGVLQWNEDSLLYEIIVGNGDTYLNAVKNPDLFATIKRKVASGYGEEATKLFDLHGVGSRFAVIEVGGKIVTATLEHIEEIIDSGTPFSFVDTALVISDFYDLVSDTK